MDSVLKSLVGFGSELPYRCGRPQLKNNSADNKMTKHFGELGAAEFTKKQSEKDSKL